MTSFISNVIPFAKSSQGFHCMGHYIKFYDFSECKRENFLECDNSEDNKPIINIGIIVMSIESKVGLRLKMQFVELIKSILDNTDTLIHFVLLSDAGKFMKYHL